MSKDEITWLESRPPKGARADVLVNLSCSVQISPHLTLDTVAVLDALGVSHLTQSGANACCGKPYLTSGRHAIGERVTEAMLERANEIGADTHVNWCPRAS